MRFSLSEFVSDLSADAMTVNLDMPGGGYDRIHHLIERRGVLPRTKNGRAALVALLLVASRLVKQQLGQLGPVVNFLNEIAEDGVREEAKRILETADRATANAALRGESPSETDAVWEMDGAARTRLLEQYRRLDVHGQEQMRRQMMRSTATELALLAGMPREDLRTLLDILAPAPTHRSGMCDRIAIGFFPWLKDKKGI